MPRKMREIYEKACSLRTYGGQAIERNELVSYLSWNWAKHVVAPWHERKYWQKERRANYRIKENMRVTIEAAWSYVAAHNAVAAAEVFYRARAWLWMLRLDGVVAIGSSVGQHPVLGAEAFRRICLYFKWPLPTDLKLRRQMVGLPCVVGCTMCERRQ